MSLKAWFKGKTGELKVNIINSLLLDKNIYKQLKDITLKLKDGTTTQIDHLIISKHGIFVIETKNYKGWIFGSENQKEWTQTLFKQKNKFQNPLHQNYRHIKSIQEVLNELIIIDENKFRSVIAFVGEVEFKTNMPKNVFKGNQYISYIKSFKNEILKEREIITIINKLGRKREKQGIFTDIKHVKNLNKRHS